jgi:hypothetical protein
MVRIFASHLTCHNCCPAFARTDFMPGYEVMAVGSMQEFDSYPIERAVRADGILNRRDCVAHCRE